MMSKRFFIGSLVVIGLLLNMFSFIVHSDPVLTTDISNHITLLSHSEGITHFSLVFSIKKVFMASKGVSELSNSDIGYNMVEDFGLSNFNKRFIKSEMEVTTNKTHYIISVNLYCKASNTSHFKVDIIPKLKNQFTVNKLAWWNNNWLYCRTITIDHNQVDTTLYDFPVGLTTNSNATDLDHAQNDGDDFAFTNIQNTTQLAHEIEYYDGGDNLTAWINLSRVSSTTDTKFCMYYGNPSCANQEDITGVWNTTIYKGVFHLHQGSGTIYDSTSYNVDSTAQVITTYMVDGKFGRCVYLDGTNDYINFGDSTIVDGEADLSLEGWGYWDGELSNPNAWIIAKSWNFNCYRIGLSDDSGPPSFQPDKGRVLIVDANPLMTITTNLDNADWFYLAGRLDNNDDKTRIYYNGAEEANIAETDVIPNTDDYLAIGASMRPGSVGNRWKGYLDEIRIVTDWDVPDGYYSTMYNMIDDNSNFLSIGGEASYTAPNNHPYYSSFNFVNGSFVYSCYFNNISFYINDTEGDGIDFNISVNNEENSGTALNKTVYLNLSNILMFGKNYTVTVWLNDSTHSNKYFFYLNTYDDFCNCLCGDNMNVTVGFDNTLVFTMLLSVFWLVFASLHFKYRSEVMIAFVCFLVSMPLTFLYGSMGYGFAFGYVLAGFIPLISIVIIVDSYFYSHRIRRNRYE